MNAARQAGGTENKRETKVKSDRRKSHNLLFLKRWYLNEKKMKTNYGRIFGRIVFPKLHRPIQTVLTLYQVYEGEDIPIPASPATRTDVWHQFSRQSASSPLTLITRTDIR